MLGLTDEGKALVDKMMHRGMLVDVAHMSERSVHDVHALAVARDHYPIYMSHGHFREIMTPDKQREEKTTPAWVIQILRETGGMFGLRTGHEEVNTYAASGVDNDCHGSTRSFAQAYDFGRLGLKVAMALGTDFNGFIQQTRPRFGTGACSASFPTEGQCQAGTSATPARRRSAARSTSRASGTSACSPSCSPTSTSSASTPPRCAARPTTSCACGSARRARARGPPDRRRPRCLGDHRAAGSQPARGGVSGRVRGLVLPRLAAGGEVCRFAAECASGSCVGAGGAASRGARAAEPARARPTPLPTRRDPR